MKLDKRYERSARILALLLFFMSLQEASSEIFPLRPTYPGFVSAFLASGRGISVILLLSFLLINYKILKQFNVRRSPRVLVLIFLIHVVLAVKLVYYGNVTFAAASIVVVGVQIFLLSNITNFYNNATNSEFLAQAISKFGVMLVSLNLGLVYFYPDSAYIDGTRLVGSMPNPQHLMMALTLVLPSFLFMLSLARTLYGKGAFLALIACLVFLVLETGSRSGLATVIVVLAFYFSIGSSVVVSMTVVVLAIIGVATLDSSTNSFMYDFFLSRGDTRSHVILREWQAFLESPLFGTTLEEGARYVYSENLWVSFLSNGGIAVGIALFAVVVGIIRRVIRIFNRVSVRTPEFTLLMFGTISVLALSLFESVFAGTYSSFALISFLYLAMPVRTDQR